MDLEIPARGNFLNYNLPSVIIQLGAIRLHVVSIFAL